MKIESIEFLSTEEVENLHREQVRMLGGLGGLQDRHALDSAVSVASIAPNTPDSTRRHEVMLIAAAYAGCLSQAQAFASCNTSTALYAALYFLAINGYFVQDPDGEIHSAMLAVTTQATSKRALAEVLDKWAFQVPGTSEIVW